MSERRLGSVKIPNYILLEVCKNTVCCVQIGKTFSDVGIVYIEGIRSFQY